MVKRMLRIFLVAIALFSTCVFALEQNDTLSGSSLLLLNTHYTSRLENGDSIIYLYFNFNKTCPNYFYEIMHKDKKIVFTLENTRLGEFATGDTFKKVNLGPVKTVSLKEQIKNKNDVVKGLIPELYSVINMTINCDPVIKNENSIDIIDKDKTLSIMLKWPESKAGRRSIYYFPRKKRPGLIWTIAGIGAAGLAGGGYALYHFIKYRDDKDSQLLNPVLPEHPTGQ